MILDYGKIQDSNGKGSTHESVLITNFGLVDVQIH